MSLDASPAAGSPGLVILERSPARRRGLRWPPGWTSDRWAALAFGVAAAVSFVVLLAGPGSVYWFVSDDMRLLATDGDRSLAGLFEPENLHWSTTLLLVFRGLYRVVGLRSYAPYQAAVILLHLVLVLQLRVVMRRAGVGAWMATLVAGIFLLYGPAEQNILFAVQVGMMGSMVMGLAHLVLADHDGGFGRRDLLGLGCGLVGLMSSGVAPNMVAIVGLAVLIRRGWLMALAHTVPLAGVFGLWWVSQRSILATQELPDPSLADVGDWVVEGMVGVFAELGQYPVLGVATAALVVVGLALAWLPLPWSRFRKEAAVPVALLVGGVALFGIVAAQRGWMGVSFARSSRYLGMSTAMILPSLGIAADAVARRWRWATPGIALLLLVPAPARFAAFDEVGWHPSVFADVRRVTVAAAYAPDAERTSPEVTPDGDFFRAHRATMAFLLEARDSGRLPPPPEVDDDLARELEVRLTLRRIEDPSPLARDCVEEPEPVTVTPAVGDRIVVRGGVSVTNGRGPSRPVTFSDPWGGPVELVVELPDKELILSPPARSGSLTICG